MPSSSQKPATPPDSTPAIHADMPVDDILALVPDAGPLVARYGLHCFSCDARSSETLREGCATHGMPEEELCDLVQDLNTLYRTQPKRPATIEITDAAADALAQILSSEHSEGGLCVMEDASGRYCLEYRAPAPEDRVFSHSKHPAVRVFVSTATLARIGGAVIDMRDGRFKLDLGTQNTQGCACKNGESCACGAA